MYWSFKLAAKVRWCYSNLRDAPLARQSPSFQGALNSAVECHLHTVEVIGSNPIAPTIFFRSPSDSIDWISPRYGTVRVSRKPYPGLSRAKRMSQKCHYLEVIMWLTTKRQDLESNFIKR